MKNPKKAAEIVRRARQEDKFCAVILLRGEWTTWQAAKKEAAANREMLKALPNTAFSGGAEVFIEERNPRAMRFKRPL